MKRLVYDRLVKWKNKTDRKPLILYGARQVGKTWLLREFGDNEYSNVAYINCDEVGKMKTIFSDFDTERLIRSFSVLSGQTIKPRETLIVESYLWRSEIVSLKSVCWKNRFAMK